MTIPSGDLSPLKPSPQSGSVPADLPSSGLRNFLRSTTCSASVAPSQTSELRHRAAESGYFAGLVERVYSHLVALQRQGRIARVSARAGSSIGRQRQPITMVPPRRNAGD